MQTDNAGDRGIETWAIMHYRTADTRQEKSQLMLETWQSSYMSLMQVKDAMPMLLIRVVQNMKRGVPHQSELACPPTDAGA